MRRRGTEEHLKMKNNSEKEGVVYNDNGANSKILYGYDFNKDPFVTSGG